VIVWTEEADGFTTTVGVLDPHSGRVAVLGRTGAWGPQTTCLVEAGTVACSAVGDLTVWRLPDAGSR
jgi:hypothetical protein